jgi:hypothetical protein
MSIDLVIVVPGLRDPGVRAARLEEPLDCALAASGLGQVTGGGAWLNGRGSEVSVTLRDQESIPELRRILRAIAAPRRTIIRRQFPREEYSVYYRPFWQLLQKLQRRPERAWYRVGEGDLIRPGKTPDAPTAKVLLVSAEHPEFLVLGLYGPHGTIAGTAATIQPFDANRWPQLGCEPVSASEFAFIPEHRLQDIVGIEIDFTSWSIGGLGRCNVAQPNQATPADDTRSEATGVAAYPHSRWAAMAAGRSA